MKMAGQYEHARGNPHRARFLTIRSGYHGDTFHAMSVCDPVTGMHHLFAESLPRQHFVEAPVCRFGAPWDPVSVEPLAEAIDTHRDQLAGVILEPIVQGAGGMRFYAPQYLRQARGLCDRHDVLLIFDEIATGFGRTGRMFAAEHAGVAPDIMCVGKALTGGYMTMAATLANGRVSDGICADGGAFMHGPTFMANPLACAVAAASIRLLRETPWRARVANIEARLREGLAPCAALDHVADVRVLGAIGVVELRDPVEVAAVQRHFVERGVWIRPFGRLVYLMPPYIIDNTDLAALIDAIVDVVTHECAPA
jgi:adenosylmethionine-8-amino-7-oxononanoate aminotransferase